MHRNHRLVAAALAAAALAVPAAAGAQPGGGMGHEKSKQGKQVAKQVKKQAKKVTFVFKGTFTAPGTVEVVTGNAHARKGGFLGAAVSFDLASAKVVVADTNGDQSLDVTDVKDGDLVLVQARLARGTKYAEGADAVVARKLVDKTSPAVEDPESGS